MRLRSHRWAPFGLRTSGQAQKGKVMSARSSSQPSRAPQNAARWRFRRLPSTSAAPFNDDGHEASPQPAIRMLQPCAVLATLAVALVLLAIMGLNLDVLPELPAKIIIGISLPVFYGTAIGAISSSSRRGPAARHPGPRRDDAIRLADDDLRQPSEAERLSARRRTRLVALGVPEDVALVLAEDPVFSVQELNRLRAQGCPLDVAVRILQPI